MNVATSLAGLLDGIMVDEELEAEAKAHGLKLEERPFTLQEAHDAREAFITSASQFVTPVVKIDGRVIGNGKPGAITRRLVEQYRALTKASGEPIYD